MAKKNDRVVYAKLTKPTNIVQEIKDAFVSVLKKKDFELKEFRDFVKKKKSTRNSMIFFSLRLKYIQSL